jgi:4-hydroxybenzoate-CoA ligase
LVSSSESGSDVSPKGQLSLPRDYNAASHFIDRHLADPCRDKIAFIDDRGRYTYTELAERVNRAGNALKSLGLEMEHRVMLCLLDGIEFPSLFWGALKIGAVAVPISTMLTSSDYDHMLHDSRARVLVLSEPLLERFEPILAGQPHLKTVVVVGRQSADGDRAYRNFEALTAASASSLNCAGTVIDDAALWLYTSGSTGKPKAAVHLHGDLAQTASLYGEGVLGIGENDIVFSGAKLFFAYGLGNAMTFPLHVGATSVLMPERSTPDAVMSVMRRHNPTVFFGVPTLYSNILADPEFDRSKSSDRLRLCVSAGEALPENISRGWVERFGVEIVDGIGSTEALHTFISNRPGDLRYGTSGKPVPGYEIRLTDENGREVDTGEVGDLWCAGPSISPCYWNNRAMSLKTFVGGWLRTGDKYIRDADGYYHYVGRTDDMLKAGGIWVSPFEVESTLREHPEVLHVAVVGVADRHGLIKPKAFVVLKSGAKGSPEVEEELKSFVKERLAHFKCPRWIEFRSELPMTPTGKIQRYKLR